MSEREKLVSVTRDDFEWSYFRAGGKGGQAQNKTSSGVRVKHPPSGAVAESREARDQLTNKRLAFQKIVKDPKFRGWLSLTASVLEGKETPEQVVEKLMADDNIKVEVRRDNKWVEVGDEQQEGSQA
jgi:hypothetical protein